ILTINSVISEAGAPQDFHPEAQYLIKVDLDGDAVEDLTYRCVFGERGDMGVQGIELRRLAGRDAGNPAALGTKIGEGVTGDIIDGAAGIRLWAGLAYDPFAIDRSLWDVVARAFKTGARLDLSGWQADTAENLFAGSTVSAIVLEIPDAEITW